jgi:hypothetical protein
MKQLKIKTINNIVHNAYIKLKKLTPKNSHLFGVVQRVSVSPILFSEEHIRLQILDNVYGRPILKGDK